MPSTSYVPTLLQTSSPTNGGPLAPMRLCLGLHIATTPSSRGDFLFNKSSIGRLDIIDHK